MLMRIPALSFTVYAGYSANQLQALRTQIISGRKEHGGYVEEERMRLRLSSSRVHPVDKSSVDEVKMYHSVCHLLNATSSLYFHRVFKIICLINRDAKI